MIGPEDLDPSQSPIHVAEVVVSAWQWDAWRESAEAAGRSARAWSVVVGGVVTVAAATAGLVLLPGAAKYSVVLYAPLVAWPVASWIRSALARRRLAPVLAEVKPLVEPRLVPRIDDDDVLRLLDRGGALLVPLSTKVVVERRDAAVAVIASEYDLQYSQGWNMGGAGSAGY